jgi:hypothetical protein
MKSKNQNLLRCLIVVAVPAIAAFSQSATATNIPATVRIYVPITVSLTNSGLSFGDVYANVPGGNVVLDPATDLRTTTGGLLLGTGGDTHSAVLKVAGVRGTSIAITLPADAIVTLVGPGTTMAVNAWTAAVGAVALKPPLVASIPNVAGATLSFKVGATLVVPANQLDGIYTGSFAVTVAYN